MLIKKFFSPIESFFASWREIIEFENRFIEGIRNAPRKNYPSLGLCNEGRSCRACITEMRVEFFNVGNEVVIRLFTPPADDL